MTITEGLMSQVDWPTAKIGDLFDSWGGHTPSKANAAYWGDGLPWVSSRDVKTARLATSTHSVTLRAVEETGLRVCPVGSVLVVMRSGVLAHTLPVSVTEVPVTINQDLKAFHSDEPYLNEWLALFLRMSAQRLLAASRRDGTTVQSVQYPLLKNTEIPVPPMPERRTLIEAIDALHAKQTTILPLLSSTSRTAQQIRQAILAAACSGRLTADWREEHASEGFAQDLINRSRGLLKEMGQRIPAAIEQPNYLEIPETWEWAPLGWLAAIKGGIQKQPKRAPKQNVFPYLRVANVLRGNIDLTEVHQMELFEGELDIHRLKPEDLLVVEGNGSLAEIGRSAIWNGQIPDCVHQNHIIRVRCLEADSEYINNFWNSPLGAREIADLAVTSAGLYNLSVGKVSAFPVPVPPLDEQREIVRRVDAYLKLAASILEKVQAASKQVERSSQAVLDKAFRGELVPTQDVV